VRPRRVRGAHPPAAFAGRSLAAGAIIILSKEKRTRKNNRGKIKDTSLPTPPQLYPIQNKDSSRPKGGEGEDSLLIGL